VRVRNRALSISGASFSIVIILLVFLPFPYNFKAYGVLKADGHVIVVNKTTGQVQEYFKKNGSLVHKNDTLLRLDNLELYNQLRIAHAAVQEATHQYAKALIAAQADLEPIKQRMEAYSKRVSYLKTEISNLTVRAEIDGIWLAPDVDNFTGQWLTRGTPLGKIIDHSEFYFASVIPQKDISNLFSQKPRSSQVRLSGQSQHILEVADINTIPMEQDQLPSSALGFTGGGTIAVAPDDSSGRKTIEPFYEVRAAIKNDGGATLLHGRSGQIQFFLGHKPLLSQGVRKVLQLLQKHYRM
jgi:putative peptide zinc metalloprotease protein